MPIPWISATLDRWQQDDFIAALYIELCILLRRHPGIVMHHQVGLAFGNRNFTEQGQKAGAFIDLDFAAVEAAAGGQIMSQRAEQRN